MLRSVISNSDVWYRASSITITNRENNKESSAEVMDIDAKGQEQQLAQAANCCLRPGCQEQEGQAGGARARESSNGAEAAMGK